MINQYTIKRFGQMVLVFFAAVTVTFILYRLMPAGPVEVLRNQLLQDCARQGGCSAAQIQRINRQVELFTGINPDKPLHVNYYQYMRDIILYQDFGQSIRLNEPVFDLLFERMPWSVYLSFYGLVIGRTVSLGLGALMAQKEGSRLDTGLTVYTIFTQSIPYYLWAILAILLFGFGLGLFPTAGKYAPDVVPGFNLPFMMSIVEYSALPILSIALSRFAGALGFRGNAIREKGKEYIRVARIRGVDNNRIALRYVGRNALLPIYTNIMLGISALFGSSVIIETIFNYQAVGLLTFNALLNRDYPLLMGAFIFYTAVTVLGIFIADLTYGIIDPRVEGGGERETY
jgi:peptide/nickel transport system permease protein